MYKLVRTVMGRGIKANKLFMSYRFFLVAALLLAILSPSLIVIPASANPGLTVSNALILEDVTPGQTFTQTMTVSIASADPATNISVKVDGVAQNLQGGYELLDAAQDTGPYSARTFVTVDKSSFHLEPGGSQDVTATVQVPQNVGDGGRYAIINFSTQPTAGSGVSIITAVDVPVYLTIAGSQIIQTGKITGISVSEIAGDKPVGIMTSFQNTGNHHFKVKGEVTVKDARGQTIGDISIPLTSSSILPGMTRQLQATLNTPEALAVGIYTIDSKVTLDDGTLLDESTGNFEVKAPAPSVSSTSPDTSATPSSPVPSGSTQYTPAPVVPSIDLIPSSASTLKSDDGSISIYFPAGAAVTPVKVSLLNVPADQVPDLPSGVTLASTCFQVDGLTGLLAKDATVTVKYNMADLDRAGGNASRLKLARWDDGISQWKILNTKADTGTRTLSANSNQMGIWAVVAGPSTSPGMNLTLIGIIIGGVIVVGIIAMSLLIKRRK